MSRAKRKACAQTGHNPCRCGKRSQKKALAQIPLTITRQNPGRYAEVGGPVVRIPTTLVTPSLIQQLRNQGYVEYDEGSAGDRRADWQRSSTGYTYQFSAD